MHELSVCQALIIQVEQVAARERATRVNAVHLSIGPLSGVEPQLLEQAFPLAAAGSVAGAASLHIEAAPIRVHCARCDHTSAATASRLVCARCGDWRTTLVSGDELLLTHLELTRESAHV